MFSCMKIKFKTEQIVIFEEIPHAHFLETEQDS